MNAEDIYTWICFRYDEVGLVTADLKQNDETIDTLGGSYPKWTPVRIDATRKWGFLPTHWDGFKVSDMVEIAGVIETGEDDNS